MSEAEGMEEWNKSQLGVALGAAKHSYHYCMAAGVPDAVLAAAGELVELLEAWAKETGVR